MHSAHGCLAANLESIAASVLALSSASPAGVERCQLAQLPSLFPSDQYPLFTLWASCSLATALKPSVPLHTPLVNAAARPPPPPPRHLARPLSQRRRQQPRPR